jgi:hypothetical protein
VNALFGGVNVANAKAHCFAHPKFARIDQLKDHPEMRFVTLAPQPAAHFLPAQHNRQPL